MKPNGRRAWRKWLKSQRKHNKDLWAADIGACPGRAAYARRHRGTDAGQGLPGAVPGASPQPFTARSLVGMSEAAKKRAVRAELEPKWWFGIKHGVSAHAVGEYARDVETVRTKYRIGERLRQCLGCSWCGTDPGDLPDDKWTECDGSGVLPARKAKR